MTQNNVETTCNNSSFTAYDYMEIPRGKVRISLMLDSYQNFGWQTEENRQSKVNVLLKRPRKIANKTELTRLQRHFEASLDSLDMLEKSRTSAAKVVAFAIAFLGTAFMAGAVFAVTATPPAVWLCVLLGFFGFAGWIAPIFAYRKISKIKSKDVDILLERQYEEISIICEKAYRLL